MHVLRAWPQHTQKHAITIITISQFPARPFRRFGQNRRASKLGNRINKLCETFDGQIKLMQPNSRAQLFCNYLSTN